MLHLIHKFSNLENIYLVDIQNIHTHQQFRICKIMFIIYFTHSMLLFLHSMNFIKFSSSCASPRYIAIVYIVMNKGEIYAC